MNQMNYDSCPLKMIITNRQTSKNPENEIQIEAAKHIPSLKKMEKGSSALEE